MELVNDLTIVVARVLIATDSFLAGTGKTNKERRQRHDKQHQR
jgi:hypothetical protein